MSNPFQRATRKQLKAKVALSGPSGSGKTYSAMLLAKALGKNVAIADTEKRSSELYTNLVDFDILDITAPYSPEVYIQAIKDAEANGYDVLIMDSVTHEWNGVGGILEIVGNAARKFRGNKYAGWDEGTRRHRRFVDAILQADLHVIVTMRSKTAYVEVEQKTGKKSYEKAGMEPEQRDGFEYEFTVVWDVDREHIATVSKDRTQGLFDDPHKISAETGEILLNWLSEGEAEKPVQEPVFREPAHQDTCVEQQEEAPKQDDPTEQSAERSVEDWKRAINACSHPAHLQNWAKKYAGELKLLPKADNAEVKKHYTHYLEVLKNGDFICRDFGQMPADVCKGECDKREGCSYEEKR